MEEKKTSGKASVDILAKLLQYKQNFCVKERFLSSAISMTPVPASVRVEKTRCQAKFRFCSGATAKTKL